MAHSSFGQPCSGPIVTLVRKDGLRIPVHKELVDLTAMLMDLTEMMGYNLVPGWCWGFACRHVRGSTNVWSNHAWGASDDLNAPKNPMASAQYHRDHATSRPFGIPLVTDIPEKVVKLWESHGYRWGGRYATRPDPMHFEFMKSVTDARAITKRLRAYLAGEGAPAPKPPVLRVDVKTAPTLRQGSKGSAVKKLQTMLVQCASQKITIDGDFGPATHRAVVNVQKFFGAAADGIVGPKTWGVLNYACALKGR